MSLNHKADIDLHGAFLLSLTGFEDLVSHPVMFNLTLIIFTNLLGLEQPEMLAQVGDLLPALRTRISGLEVDDGNVGKR